MRLEPVQKGVAGGIPAGIESLFFGEYLLITKKIADFHRVHSRSRPPPPRRLAEGGSVVDDRFRCGFTSPVWMDRRTKRTLVRRLNRDAAVIAARFGLRYRAIEAEAAQVKRRYGICYSDGTIRIRLRHATTGKPLKYSSLISTLCHELAHLKHFDHGYGFQSFYSVILEYARDQGIYRPSRRPAAVPIPSGEAVGDPAARVPRQLSLF
jgi:hypothetical protein